jgi:hypothetical protein
VPALDLCKECVRLVTEDGLWTWIYVGQGKGRDELAGQTAMNSDDVVIQAETDEPILTFDIADHVLERAASSENMAFTLFYCTSPSYGCSMPR